MAKLPPLLPALWVNHVGGSWTALRSLAPSEHYAQEGTQISNGLRLSAVEVNQSPLQQARLWRENERGEVRNILRFTQPHDVCLADKLFDGGIDITAALRRFRLQQKSKPVRAH